MLLLPYLAPLFLIFEVWQLIVGERYLGLKQIARGADPRALGLAEFTAFAWCMMLFTYWTWMVLLVFTPLGRIHGLVLLAISLFGFLARRSSPMKWVLVVLTLEGAVRFGLLVSLTWMMWWRRS